MTDTSVVDASAIGAILFGEPEGVAVARALGEDRLVAPQLLGYELANICWKKIRRQPDLGPSILSAYGARSRLAIAEHVVDLDQALLLANAAGLSAYDASYLWLARHLGVPLVTLDNQLLRAAAGVR